MSKDKEIWKDIPGFEGLYQASSHGRIRSLDRYVGATYPGGKMRLFRGKILRQAINRQRGYLSVMPSKDGKQRNHTVHQLVAAAFLGERGDLHVNHIDGDKTNNRADNLEYCTRSENQKHAVQIGLLTNSHSRGENNFKAKLTEEVVKHARDLFAKGESPSSLAKKYGVSKTAMRAAVKGISWKHV